METEKFAKQMIDFQKATFNNTFNAMIMMQDQTERLFETALEQTPWLPEEGRRAIDEWTKAYKKGRSEFKGIVDENFVKLTDLFIAAPVVKTRAPQPVKTK
jgi:division protein CdvB (Snf7/Vps24/ESCRT-III family)